MEKLRGHEVLDHLGRGANAAFHREENEGSFHR